MQTIYAYPALLAAAAIAMYRTAHARTYFYVTLLLCQFLKDATICLLCSCDDAADAMLLLRGVSYAVFE